MLKFLHRKDLIEELVVLGRMRIRKVSDYATCKQSG